MVVAADCDRLPHLTTDSVFWLLNECIMHITDKQYNMISSTH